jgi:hypothetical protein
MTSKVQGNSLADQFARQWMQLLDLATRCAGDLMGGRRAFTEVALAVFTDRGPDAIEFNLAGAIAKQAAKYLSDSGPVVDSGKQMVALAQTLELAVTNPLIVQDLLLTLRTEARRTDPEVVLSMAAVTATFNEEIAFHVSRLPLSAALLLEHDAANQVGTAGIDLLRHSAESLKSFARAACQDPACSDRPEWVLEHVAGALCGTVNPRLAMTPCATWALFFRRKTLEIRRDGLARRLAHRDVKQAGIYFRVSDPRWGE